MFLVITIRIETLSGRVWLSLSVIVVTLVCVTLWNRVQLESHLGDHGLNSALAQQKVSSDEVAGYTRSQDELPAYFF